MSLSLGQTVVHPHHGAAVVDQFEERDLNGETARYVVLTLSHNDLTLKIPSDVCDEIGIREVITEDAADGILEILGRRADTSNKHWSRRLKKNQRSLRSGDPAKVAEVVRDLTAKDLEKGLSPAEKRLRDKARQMLEGELAAAVGEDDDTVATMIDEALGLELADA